MTRLNTADSHGELKPRDLVDFARWQLECGPRGWTAEPAPVIADRWGVTVRTVRASRQRLTDLGLLTVEPREPGRAPIVWLKEVYDPHWQPAPPGREIQPPSEVWLEQRQLRGTVARGRSALARSAPDKAQLVSDDLVAGCVADDPSRMLPGMLPAAVAVDALVPLSDVLDRIVPSAAGTALTASAGAEVVNAALAKLAVPAPVEPDEWLRDGGAPADVNVLDHLRRVRSARRRTAIALLVSPRRDPEARETRRAHEVSRITVGNRRMAELVEIDVLSAVEPWHQLGDRDRPGGGFTEMWSDEGPTVDLASFVAAAEELVTRVRNLCEGP